MNLMWTGSVIGVLLGLVHAMYVFNVVAGRGVPSGSRNYLRGNYFAFWTFLLWILFGTYILVLWIIGMFFYLVFKAYR